MEIQATIEFDVDEHTASVWQDIMAGLNQDKQGAWLEDQFEHLGEAAASALESLLDDCERSHQEVHFEAAMIKGSHCLVSLMGGYGLPESLARIRLFLEVCGVQNITMSHEGDE